MKQPIKRGASFIKRELRQNHESGTEEMRKGPDHSNQENNTPKHIINGNGLSGYNSRSGSRYAYDKAYFSRRNTSDHHRDSTDEPIIYEGRCRWEL
ncbi:MAG TPA: hypothetical protein VFM99_07380 [Chitinophagales bacterium]|nr:hypothetical protein [Chitinophagales bacterium]